MERLDFGEVAVDLKNALARPPDAARGLARRLAAADAPRAPPALPICLYGLYAPVSRDLTVGVLADRVIAGEYEPALLAWVESFAHGGQPPGGAGGAGAP